MNFITETPGAIITWIPILTIMYLISHEVISKHNKGTWKAKLEENALHIYYPYNFFQANPYMHFSVILFYSNKVLLIFGFWSHLLFKCKHPNKSFIQCVVDIDLSLFYIVQLEFSNIQYVPYPQSEEHHKYSHIYKLG